MKIMRLWVFVPHVVFLVFVVWTFPPNMFIWCNLMLLQVIFLMSVCLLEIVAGQRNAEKREDSHSTTLMAQREQRRPSWAALYGKSEP